jgi:hypothetical protein
MTLLIKPGLNRSLIAFRWATMRICHATHPKQQQTIVKPAKRIRSEKRGLNGIETS